jgi:exportin-5
MMKGLRDSVDPAQMNGSQPALAANGTPNSVSQIVEALTIVHNAQSSKESRQQASGLLEEAKINNDAPYHGFTLAVDHGQPPIVRHYGLSLLEYAIRHRWSGYTEEQSTALREWVLALAQGVSEEDPGYVRNKVAQLWVEVAKRSWALEWIDMDKMLVELWRGPLVRKDMVLSVLETLSEDIFSREDTTAGLRGNDLNRACVEIFTPAIVLTQHFPTRENNFNVRYGDEGWLVRIGDMLDWCLENDVHGNEKVRNSAVKALAVLRTAMAWAIPKAIITARCVVVILKSLAVQDTQIRMVRILSWPMLCLSRTTNPS